MKDEDPEVYTLYGPLRNYLRVVNLIKGLRAIHSHSQHLLFGTSLLNSISNLPFRYKQLRVMSDYVQYQMLPWELETLAKEIIINSPEVGSKKNIEDWNCLVAAINKIKELEDEISVKYVDTANVLIEVHRIAHKQFPWQIRPNLEQLSRYWKIYSYSKLAFLIEEVFGLTLEEVYIIGFALIGLYLDKFALFYPPNIFLLHLNQGHLDKFLSHFSIPLEDLKKKLINEQEYNERYAYAFNSLKAYPLIKTEYDGRIALICPLPILLYRRLNEGLYYEICGKTGFDEAFGESFQSFVGELLNRGNPKAKIIPETIYRKYKKEKRTVDWIMTDDSAILFIECKAKRLTLEAKISLTDHTELDKEFDKLSNSVVQVYKTLLDYKQNLYPNLQYNPNKTVYPFIITSEEWYLFGDKLSPMINAHVRDKLIEEKIPEDILITNPFTICSLDSLNLLVQVSRKYMLDKIIKHSFENIKYKFWSLDSVIRDAYPGDSINIESLFKKEFDSYIKGIQNRKNI